MEREIVPEVRAASRLNLYPRAIPYKPQGKELVLSEPDNVVEMPAAIAALEPAHTEDAVGLTPWRGYVDAGYFPVSNAVLSAGYAILSDAVTKLNVWGQLNNKSYKGSPSAGFAKETFDRLAGHAGIDFSHSFKGGGNLQVSTGIGFSSFGQPWSIIAKSIEGEGSTETQNVLEWGVAAMWQGRGTNSLDYHIGAGVDIFNFSKGLPAGVDFDGLLPGEEAEGVPHEIGNHTIPAVHQTGFDIDLGVKQRINGESEAGVDVTADFLSYNHFQGEGGKTIGVAAVKPYYSFGNSVVTLKAGLRMDLTINSGKALHVAPDVLLGVNPASGFGAWVRLGGGEKMNSLRTLFDFSPYISQIMAYGTSNIPVTGDLGLRFGPVHGVSLTLGMAYAAANNWLLPAMTEGQLLFRSHDLRAWKASAKLHWEFRKMLSVDASFETTMGDGDKEVWMQWRDRARHRIAAALSIRPIEKLTVDVSYEMHMKRRMPMLWGYNVVAGNADDDNSSVSVGMNDVNDLGIGAAYSVTDAFTVFARAENLFDTKTYLLPMVPEQGVTGLVGVAYKF